MFQPNVRKNNLIKVVVVIIALAGVALLVWLILSGGKTSKTAKVAQNPAPETTKVSQNLPQLISILHPEKGNLPEGFPEIPLNGKQKLGSAYILSYEGQNQNQKVIDFTSSKSVKENLAFYKDWTEKNGWNIMHQLDDQEESRLIIEKDKKPLNITIQKDASASSKVNMSW